MESLEGAAFGVEGDPAAVRRAAQLVRFMGGRAAAPGAPKPCRFITRAAVMASNYLVALADLARSLLRNAGRVLTRMQLIDRVWGADYVGDTKTLDVHVKRLRAKIEPDPGAPRYLVTVRGLGYKFEP